MEIVNLNELVVELTDLFEQDLETGCIRLTVDGTLPELHCERARLRQVFQNLIDNAIKYMGEPVVPAPSAGQSQSPSIGEPACGELVESVELVERVEPARPREITIGHIARGGEAEFYVGDTGVGIAPDDLERVFHVFRRGSGEAVQNVAGKGVGLASVKSIVETYNGTIWVESTVGVGSTFRFTINGKHLGDPVEATPASMTASDQYKCPAA